MADDKRAAIDLDAVHNKTLRDVSAADFLEALDAGGISGMGHRPWNEKKKVELLTGPENLGGITVGGLLKGLREKKKVEIEKDPRPELDFIKHRGAETEFVDREDLVTNPAFTTALEEVVSRVVARQLSKLRG
jgi:hypothetical protein